MRSVKPISFGKRATKQDSVKFDNSFGLFSHFSHVFFFQLLLGYLSAAILYAPKSGQLKAKTLFDLGLLHGTGWSEKGWSKGGSTSRFFALTSITGWVTCRILSDYTHPTVSYLPQFRLLLGVQARIHRLLPPPLINLTSSMVYQVHLWSSMYIAYIYIWIQPTRVRL